MISKIYLVIIYCCLLAVPLLLKAGQSPKNIFVFKGTTPILDGRISQGEYNDATIIKGLDFWTHELNMPHDEKELSIIGYVKHDGENLFFSFDVTDDVIYNYDIERWLPDRFPDANDLSIKGFPWFGDGVELMINAGNTWDMDTPTKGDGTSWQMVCSTHKSRLHGLKNGGLLEGEPRHIKGVFERYQNWIINADMQAVVRIKDKATEGNGYVIEWMIHPNPCLEVAPGFFWNNKMQCTEMGLNIELQDLDEKVKGNFNFSNFHHIEYWSANIYCKDYLSQWGTMIIYNHKDPKK